MHFQICKDKSHWKQLDIFKHRQVRCKKKHILPPQAATSSVFICFADYAVTSKCNGAAAERNAFTSEWNERLHPPSLCELWRDKQASRNGVLVKSGFAAWRCEVEPDGSVKWRLASSLFFCPEFGQKNGVIDKIRPLDLLCQQLKSTLQRMNLLHKSRLATCSHKPLCS